MLSEDSSSSDESSLNLLSFKRQVPHYAVRPTAQNVPSKVACNQFKGKVVVLPLTTTSEPIQTFSDSTRVSETVSQPRLHKIHSLTVRAHAAVVIQRAWRHCRSRKRYFLRPLNALLTPIGHPSPDIIKKNVSHNPWSLLLSSDAHSVLKKIARYNPRVYDVICNHFQILASGNWTRATATTLRAPNSPLTLYECKPLGDVRVVWHVDITDIPQEEKEERKISQIIKIWSIGNHDSVFATVNKLSIVMRGYSRERLKMCKARNDKSSLILPVTFCDPKVSLDDYVQEEISDEKYDSSLLHNWLVTMKFVPWSERYMSTMLQLRLSHSSASDEPFVVSLEEYRCIQYPSSMLLSARSGTGKTSIALFRMLAVQLDAMSADQPIRQIFVTASPIFCARVRAYYYRLWSAISLKIPSNNNVVQTEQLPSLESQYWSNGEDIENETTDQLFLEEEYENQLVETIPDAYHQLTDKHFPLFVTYRKLASMLKASLRLLFTNDNHIETKPLIEISDYEWFCHTFWPHCNALLTKHVPCSLAFNEIMGVIKGSAMSSSYGRPLSRDEYLALNERRYATFSTQRGLIYSIYELYEKCKLNHNHRDTLDQGLQLLSWMRYLPKMHYLLAPIGELYVDEVQDLAVVQLKVMMRLCANVHGFFFCGDTAQTIAQGASFRFEELASTLFDHLRVQSDDKTGMKQFHLTRNYRSHDGILKCAASVLQLLTNFFPNSIDRLPRDIGLVMGPLPMFIAGNDLLVPTLTGGDSNAELEFGADQVILVRNEEVRQQLQQQLGRQVALILTVQESKGMEYNDVVLHSFFSDSSLPQHAWRLAYHLVQSKKHETPPKFDPIRHSLLAIELKVLYTALTRARQRIWIFERDAACIAPMMAYWLQNRVVQQESIETLEHLVKNEQFARKSNPQTWLRQGRTFYERQQFDTALMCFEKGRANEETIQLCKACLVRQQAQREIKSVERQRSLYSEAAALFSACQRNRTAAQCYEMSESWNEAVKLYVNEKLWSDAARVYKILKQWVLAAGCLEKCQQYDDALWLYVKGQRCGRFIACMKKNRASISNASSLLNVAIPVFDTNSSKEEIDSLLELYDNDEEKIVMARLCKSDSVVHSILQRQGKGDEQLVLKIHQTGDYIFSENISDPVKSVYFLCQFMQHIALSDASFEQLQNFANIIGDSGLLLKRLQEITSTQIRGILESKWTIYYSYIMKDWDKLDQLFGTFKRTNQFGLAWLVHWMLLRRPVQNADEMLKALNLTHEFVRMSMDVLAAIYKFNDSYHNNLLAHFESLFLIHSTDDDLLSLSDYELNSRPQFWFPRHLRGDPRAKLTIHVLGFLAPWRDSFIKASSLSYENCATLKCAASDMMQNILGVVIGNTIFDVIITILNSVERFKFCNEPCFHFWLNRACTIANCQFWKGDTCGGSVADQWLLRGHIILESFKLSSYLGGQFQHYYRFIRFPEIDEIQYDENGEQKSINNLVYNKWQTRLWNLARHTEAYMTPFKSLDSLRNAAKCSKPILYSFKFLSRYEPVTASECFGLPVPNALYRHLNDTVKDLNDVKMKQIQLQLLLMARYCYSSKWDSLCTSFGALLLLLDVDLIEHNGVIINIFERICAMALLNHNGSCILPRSWIFSAVKAAPKLILNSESYVFPKEPIIDLCTLLQQCLDVWLDSSHEKVSRQTQVLSCRALCLLCILSTQFLKNGVLFLSHCQKWNRNIRYGIKAMRSLLVVTVVKDFMPKIAKVFQQHHDEVWLVTKNKFTSETLSHWKSVYANVIEEVNEVKLLQSLGIIPNSDALYDNVMTRVSVANAVCIQRAFRLYLSRKSDSLRIIKLQENSLYAKLALEVQRWGDLGYSLVEKQNKLQVSIPTKRVAQFYRYCARLKIPILTTLMESCQTLYQELLSQMNSLNMKLRDSNSELDMDAIKSESESFNSLKSEMDAVQSEVMNRGVIESICTLKDIGDFDYLNEESIHVTLMNLAYKWCYSRKNEFDFIVKRGNAILYKYQIGEEPSSTMHPLVSPSGFEPLNDNDEHDDDTIDDLSFNDPTDFRIF